MKSINDIFRDIVDNTAKIYGSNVSYMFGDWEYIAGQLTEWSQSQERSKLKFPIICLYSPYEEKRSLKTSSSSLEFIIMTDTRKEYLNEERAKFSFKKVLRTVNDAFIKSILASPDIVNEYNGDIEPYSYTENFKYGRKGVEFDGKPFRDFIDAIEIKNLNIKIKNIKCYGNRI